MCRSNWNPKTRLLFCTYHKKAEDNFTSWSEIILWLKSTWYLNEDLRSLCCSLALLLPFRLCPRLLRHTRAWVRGQQACVTSAWITDVPGHMLPLLQRFCCWPSPLAWLTLSSCTSVQSPPSYFWLCLPSSQDQLLTSGETSSSTKLPITSPAVWEPHLRFLGPSPPEAPHHAQAWPCSHM